jgi:spoIIIJ-associated protein
MEWVETTAKTIDEAKSIALDQLGVGDEDAEFEIVDEPRPGLFGRMRGEARVRARVRPTRPRPKLERRDRKRKGGSSDDRSATSDRTDTSDGADEAVASAKPAGRSGAKGSKSGGTKKSAGSAGQGGPTRSTETTDTGSDAVTSTGSGAVTSTDATTDTDGSESSGRARSNQRRASQRSAAGEKAMTDNQNDRHDTERHDTPAPDAAEVGAAAVTFLTGLVDAFGLEADVTLHEVDDEMEVRVDGDNLGIMVGPRGATLLAIQDITRVASQRRLGDHQTRLRIDVAGYREKRREALARFAHKVADEVRDSGEERVLEPMPSADRKVIHDTLGDVEGVVTRSEGDDPRRYVVVAPAG